jgi:hypothetical protein
MSMMSLERSQSKLQKMDQYGVLRVPLGSMVFIASLAK